jgi:PBSX family phage terminase large subunit
MSAIFKRFGAKATRFITRHPSKDRKYTLLEGSVRSSKTFAVDAKLITWLCSYQVEGKRVICGATKQTVYKNILLDLFAVVGKRDYVYNHTTGELWLYGTQWFVIGAKDEASYKQILGMTVGLAICDEWSEFPRSFTMQLFLRMSPVGARLYATTNPSTPQHYLYTEVIHGKEFQRDLEVIHFTLNDNPNIAPEQKRQIIRSQTGVYYQRYILGLWVVAEGAIYKDAWNERLLYNDSTRPVALYGAGGFVDHVIAVDYGTTNPQVYLEFIDDGKRAWLDREYYWDSVKQMRQKTDGEYADDLQKFIAASRITSRPNPRVVIDPSAASFKLECLKRGIWVVDADNDVENGIRRMASLMASDLLRVHEECVEFRREVAIYEWDRDAATDKGEERPIKSNDHTMDAGRYGIADLFPEWRLVAKAA